MDQTASDNLKIDRRLLRAEIRAAVAHCDGLFRAGIVPRIEAEQLKNGLRTILKRADFDQHFFDSLSASDVFDFVDARLFQLINRAAQNLATGRNKEFQLAVALRLWLRDEIEIVLENLSDADFQVDAARFQEILRRVNQMPAPPVDESDEATAEIDFHEIARALKFEKLAGESNDRDFCVEFVHAAALLLLRQKRQSEQSARPKLARVIGNHAALLMILSDADAPDAPEILEIVFETVDILKSSLKIP